MCWQKFRVFGVIQTYTQHSMRLWYFLLVFKRGLHRTGTVICPVVELFRIDTLPQWAHVHPKVGNRLPGEMEEQR